MFIFTVARIHQQRCSIRELEQGHCAAFGVLEGVTSDRVQLLLVLIQCDTIVYKREPYDNGR